MADSSPLLLTLFTLLLVVVSTLRTTVSAVTLATSTVEKDLVPCTMCAECENPCQTLPPPPPPVIECPPPPPPTSPPPPPPAAIAECPPPPKPSCPSNCETPPMPWMPPGPPQPPPYPPESYFPPYLPPGTPFPDDNKNDGGKMMPFAALRFSNPSSYSVYFTTQSLISLAFLCLPYYLFI